MTYDVFMTWLSAEGKHYDILMLQETHHGLGKQFSEWVIPGYTFVSSPDPQSRYAGVAMLIATRVAKSAQVRHQVHVAGRLLHVRVPIGSGKQAAHLDLVCVYQWAWDADPEKQRAAKRQALWQRLDALLRSLPQRNSKCIAGDFNCALRPRAGCVGQHLHRNTAGYPDVEDFGVILETHHLCALNTWTRAAAHPTYKQEGDQAQHLLLSLVPAEALTAERLNQEMHAAAQAGDMYKLFQEESLILFADDFLAKFILRDMRDVQALTTHVRYLFETLEEACMTANPEKSKLHIKAAGIPLKKWLHARTVTRKGTKCLAIQTPFDTLFLPLCDSLTYLGAIVSYGAYEDQTAEHRVRAAQANVARLAKHLFTQHGMGLRVRLRLFLTCVRSSLLYGITPIGITSKSLSLLQRFEAKYIRKLARSPAHLTLERTQDLYHRLQIPTLYAALTSRANSSLDACEKPFRYPGQESVKTWLQLKLRDLAECIQLTQTSLTKVTAEGITTEGPGQSPVSQLDNTPPTTNERKENDSRLTMAVPTQAEMEVAAMFASSMPALAAAKSARREDSDVTPEKSKYHKTGQSKGIRGKGLGSLGSRKPSSPTKPTGSQQLPDTLTEETVMELLALLTRLSLKHEDLLAAYQADTCYMMYLDTSGDLSITASLYQVTQKWQATKRDNPEKLTSSLRVTLLTTLFMELRERMNMALREDKRGTLSKHSWLSESDPATWNYQKWDPATEAVVVDAGRTGLPHSEALTIIQRVLQLIPETVLIQKFHSTRPQAAEYASDVLPFMLMVSNRGALAQELYDLFQRLSDLSAMRLIGIMPIRLELKPDLQTCIDYWHNQSTRFLQALREPPQLLLLQLSRFDPQDPLRKFTAPLIFEAGQTFFMPCFAMNHDIVTVHYRVAGMLYHCGDTLHAGHYQTVLCTMRSAVSGPSGYQFHITNDGCKPRKPKPADLEHLSTGAYLIGAVRIDADPN
ncbi:unnamed protein product [Symbiodinium sp. KB8]|nr:unnamed protein product [Symbiodinium sp. KB8]